MSKHFRPWTIDATQLLPAAVADYVDANHLARFVVSLVRDELDLTEIEAAYKSRLGQPPFDPRLMVALLLYCYCKGIFASRRIARAAREHLDVMLIVAGDPPDFRTISDFRKRHLEALARLFGQVLQLCDKAGLVKLGHVALDGSKVRANASKHKAMSYGRMAERATALEAEVVNWFAAAEAADAADDRVLGADRSGDEMPAWIADKEKRAAAIRRAKAELEAEAKAAAVAAAKAQAEAQAVEAQRLAEGGKKTGGRRPAPPCEEPDPKAQKNFTDPDSAIMKTKDGFQQAYNGQAAVDAHFQIIVAQDLDACQSDQHQLVPMLDQVAANLGHYPDEASADNGFFSEPNLKALENRGIDGYVAAGRAKHATDAAASAAPPVAPPSAGDATTPTAATDDAATATVPSIERIGPPTRTEAMREKLKAGGHQSPYRLRKQLPEPVFGQIKEARGFRRFLLRGLAKVRAEWALVCATHNLIKLAKGRSLSRAGNALA